ncbi:hypothetical protein N597_04720 [Streptococcus ilei]|nr:hypothetical protein N597_04720 [Streptococcus ilei]
MLKQLNGFKKFYLFSLVFFVIELLLVVFGLSFIPILCSLWFDSLVFVLFCHFWTNFYKKRGTESSHVFSLIFSFILLLFFGFMLNMSISMSPNTIIPPIYHNARMEGNYVIIDHGSYEHGIGLWSVYRSVYHKLVNPFIMEL